MNSRPMNKRTCFQYVVVSNRHDQIRQMVPNTILLQGKFVDDNMVHGTYLLENGDEYEVSDHNAAYKIITHS